MSDVTAGTAAIIQRMAIRGIPERAICDALAPHVNREDVAAIAADARARHEAAREAERKRRIAEQIAMAALRQKYRVVEVRPRGDGRPTFAQLLDDVCQDYGFSRTEILSERRHRNVVIARHDLMYRAARDTLISLARIGRMMNGRDHTTVIHGVRRHCERNGLPHPRSLDSTKGATECQ